MYETFSESVNGRKFKSIQKDKEMDRYQTARKIGSIATLRGVPERQQNVDEKICFPRICVVPPPRDGSTSPDDTGT